MTLLFLIIILIIRTGFHVEEQFILMALLLIQQHVTLIIIGQLIRIFRVMVEVQYMSLHLSKMHTYQDVNSLVIMHIVVVLYALMVLLQSITVDSVEIMRFVVVHQIMNIIQHLFIIPLLKTIMQMKMVVPYTLMY